MKLAISLIVVVFYPLLTTMIGPIIYVGKFKSFSGGMKGYRRKSVLSHDQFVSFVVAGPNLLIHPISQKVV
jgi:hypothetical protein